MFWLGSDKQQIALGKNKSFTHFFVVDFINPTLISNNQPMTQHILISKFGNRKIINLRDGFSTILKVGTTRINRGEIRHEKKIELPLEFIKHYTYRGDVILDLFLGSGTTLIACEQSGRICYGCEIDHKTCSKIIERYILFNNSDKNVFKINKCGTKTHIKELKISTD